MKKILVPIDFSDNSIQALKSVSKLAKETNTIIYVLHVVEFDSSFSGESSPGVNLLSIALKDSPKNQLKDVFDKTDSLMNSILNKNGLNRGFVKTIKSGDLISEISEFVEENNIDLIVMGANGNRGKASFLIGSNTQKVIRYSSVPVLVIKGEVKDLAFKNIVYSSDFKEEKLNESLSYINNIKEYYNSILHLLYVNTPNKFEDTDVVHARFEKIINEYNLDNTTYSIFNSSWIEDGILKYSNSNSPDLMVINTHGFTGVRGFFHQSIAESVMSNINIPILILKKQ